MDISDEDIALFRKMNKGVRRLKNSDRADLAPEKPQPHSTQQNEHDLPKRWYDESTQALEPAPAVEAEEVLFYVRDNLPHSTLQKLKKGAFCSDLELDLHGLTTAQANSELQQLLQHALYRQLRCFRLIHGKGNRSAEQTPILKSWVNQWLRQQPEVLAFCSARQRDGGTGALYVLLKRTHQQ
ncbi:MAG: DNA mismatch repair protein MutS [Gammaproteobacteria bacterium]|jgi:DNA-nicking Smr family endonuclease|nr:DNA mismatch repair protein MutS [Gammaproteobacteria bacterium]MBT4606413.1 DNA mismatch repair protein MutS [Thiotrichales bacterium]MBT3472731.1 DNA mismatch repair protein MutS [Gammaproteobacteria bacterium]MBT3966867.1 DNA mismatch repair protein MutS [Gammaproteobacteria bacterium]MBT4081922.1 DNA mismatch repair protein MutS [Gammaproteobacteria bacterium]